MSTPTEPTTIRGLHITTHHMQQVAVPTVETWKAIQAAIGGHTFDIVGCRDGIDLHVDDEGAINGSPFNLPLTIIAHALGSPAALFGDALALGVDDEGNSQGLTDEQLQTITEAVEKPSPETIAAVIKTIDVHPAFTPIVAMLRSL